MATNLDTNGRILNSRVTLGLCLFLAAAAFLLWTEHRAHLLGILPYLILAACLVSHLFTHRGHRGHGSSTSGERGTHRHGEAS